MHWCIGALIYYGVFSLCRVYGTLLHNKENNSESFSESMLSVIFIIIHAEVDIISVRLCFLS